MYIIFTSNVRLLECYQRHMLTYLYVLITIKLNAQNMANSFNVAKYITNISLGTYLNVFQKQKNS